LEFKIVPPTLTQVGSVVDVVALIVAFMRLLIRLLSMLSKDYFKKKSELTGG
jgi:hypothetical protein